MPDGFTKLDAFLSISFTAIVGWLLVEFVRFLVAHINISWVW